MIKPKLNILIPLLDELENLETLLADIKQQTYTNFKCYFCVNQPASWYQDDSKSKQIENNQKSIFYLKEHCDFDFQVMDRSSKSVAWDEKNYGVGMARKVLMDTASKEAMPEDIMISLDADTRFHETYFESIINSFHKHPKVDTLSVPYFHPLSGTEDIDRAILRYEIYMRHYALNLWRIESPYRFTALGSAIAFRNKAYKTIGGMTPKKSGEDFYFLQKMVKYKPILHWNKEKVYPKARLSSRVFFGTGPALIKGVEGDWDSYPIYDYSLFDMIRDTYNLIPQLYRTNIPTALDTYLAPDIHLLWQKLRDNAKNLEQFTRSVHEKLDGLRILQFLKSEQAKDTSLTEEEKLTVFINKFYPQHPAQLFHQDLCFKNSSIMHLNEIRLYLVHEEENLQKAEYDQY